MKLTYICNQGVLLEENGAKLLIDAPTRPESYEPKHRYLCTTQTQNRALEMGVAPFDGLEAMLFTHTHGDHFWDEAVAERLSRDARVHACVPYSETEFLSALQTAAFENLHWLHPDSMGMPREFVFGPFRVTAFPTRHIGSMFAGEVHFAYLVSCGEQRVFHAGDTIPNEALYARLALAGSAVTLAVLPFTYVSLPSGVKVTSELIRPKRIAAVHFPCPQYDDENWIESTIDRYEHRTRLLLPPVDFLRVPGESIEL